MEKQITKIPAKARITNGSGLISKRRVCGYARVSTDLEEQVSSYKSQVKYYTDYIKNNPAWEFVGLYSDEGISATSTKNRDGFNQMVSDALDGKIDLILTKSISRFARNTVDSLTTIRKLKDKGVEVYFEKENIYTLDSKGELLITLMSSLSQEESRSISENTTWGKRRLMAEGKHSMSYSTFIGYDKGPDGKFQVNKKEAKIIVLIYDLFLRGYSFYQIKKELEKREIPAPFGGKYWHQGVIHGMLTNEKYMGDALLQKSFTVDFLTKKQKKNEGEVPQYYIKNDHEPIVSKEVFNAVQKALAERQKIINQYVGTNIITKKLRCGKCGGTMRRKVYHSNDKYRGHRYRCVNRYEGTKDCDMRIVREEVVKEEFVNAVNELIKKKKSIIEETKTILESINNVDELKAKLKSKEEELQKISFEVDELLKRNSNRTQNQESYKEKYETLENKFNETKKETDSLSKEIEDKILRTYNLKNVIDAYKHSKIITEFSEELWNTLLDKCVVYEDQIEFIWKK